MAQSLTLRWADVDQWEGIPCEYALFGFRYEMSRAVACECDCSASTVASEGDVRSTSGAGGEGGYRCDHGKKICGHGDKCHCDAAQLQLYCHDEACRKAKQAAQKEKRKRRSAARLPSWKRKQTAYAA
mmetsp:Transcript_24787/g.56593  ORF Transcript_24787/g.56593 Transcript_24787/m.56593 type:complete len:128 (+) Transcript_24787:108-491(+)|eukprot:CAMPEP_0204390510 /NCGR_PEP_ID=MMETSP0469-20131031/60745_1 /ASSEMBLY_ACC=CAM_ASM_000384 /TAXON_ID=2969 /ORGANISM="Oxyrrhis marina" /LENGTH=127 /DNA_ID=CAMNT_0051384395 /DNA_START=107 /DNA_END=490 /DNA_ORIENTATION=+